MNLGAQFKELFQQAVEVKSPSGLVFEFNTYRVDLRYKKFVFVEAQGDANFYGTTNLHMLNSEANKYIPAGKNLDDAYKGKKAVLHALGEISKNQSLKREIERCIFIVDQDYDPALDYTGIVLSDEEKDKVYLTTGYSFENYYFLESNLSYILQYLRIGEMQRNQLKNNLYKFIVDCADYFASKGAVSLLYMKTKGRLGKIPKHNDIFLFDFRNNKLVDINKYDLAIEEMKKIISQDKELQKVYSDLHKRIIENPYMVVRGHDIYNYFMAYIRNCGNNLCKYDWNKINNLLNVELKKVNVTK